MARPSSRDLSGVSRAQPSGPGPTPHLISWTPPPAQTTAPIPRSRSRSPDWPGPQAPTPRPRGAPASHSRGPRATKTAAGRAWSRGSERRPGPPSHLPTLGHTRPRASPRHPAHPTAAGSASSPRRRDYRARPSSHRRSSFLLFLLPERRARGRGPGGSGATAQEPRPPAPSAQPGRRGVAWGGAPGGGAAVASAIGSAPFSRGQFSSCD